MSMHCHKREHYNIKRACSTLRKQALCASISSLQFSSPFSTMQMSRGLFVTGQLQQMRGFSAAMVPSDDDAAAPAPAVCDAGADMSACLSERRGISVLGDVTC
jgi:hypothetical protein